MALLERMRGLFRRGRTGGAYGGRLTQGGITNLTTGLGTNLDKTEASFFTPTRIHWRSPLEVLYVQSWAAKKFCNIPIDDMFRKPRTWKDDSESNVDTMREAEAEHHVMERLRLALIGARAYGTALMVLMTNEAPMDTELVPERIRKGDLSALRVFDRFDGSVYQRDHDLWSPNYGRPLIYTVHPTWGSIPISVHHSRIIRFDGIKPLTDSKFYNYEEDWGISELIPVITSLLQDSQLASSIAHMSQEASIPVLKISELRDVIAGQAGANEATVEDIGQSVNQIKSVFRLLMLDKEREDFDRIAVQFGGLADLMDRYHLRLAAAGDIPATRFMGQSPVGMNATGASDMDNYIMMVESNRETQLAHALPLLDEVVARSAGLKEAPEWEWQSLLQTSDKDEAEAAKIKAEALQVALGAAAIDEDEFRRSIDGDPIFGELPGEAPELPESETMAIAKMKIDAEPPGGPPNGPPAG